MQRAFNATTIAAANETLSLPDFLALAANPGLLTELHETNRKEMEITSEQAAKYQEAVQFMAQYEQLSNALTQQQTDLDAARSAHAADVLAHEDKVKADNDALDGRQHELEQLSSDLSNRSANIEAEWQDMQKKYSEAISPIDAQRTQNESDRAANEAEAQRLAALSTKLTNKLNKLQAVATSDDEEETAAQ